MRHKHTFLVCPDCKRPTSLCCHSDDGSAADFYTCQICGWEGLDVEANKHEFYIEKITSRKISWNVIDEIVYAYYGHSAERFHMPHFEMVANDEWCNDSCHEFNVSPEVRDYMTEDAEKFRKDGKPRGLSNADVLDILCEDGWLAPGKYLVEVWW